MSIILTLMLLGIPASVMGNSSSELNSLFQISSNQYKPASNISTYCSLISKEENIIFGASSCTFLGSNCSIMIQIFISNFQILNQKLIKGLSNQDKAYGIIETKDIHFIFDLLSYVGPIYYINIFRFSTNLSISEILTYNKTGSSGISYSTNPLEFINSLSSSYRIYFHYRDSINANDQQVNAIDINIPFTLIVEVNENIAGGCNNVQYSVNFGINLAIIITAQVVIIIPSLDK